MRNHNTKTYLKEALLVLLENKPYKEITVKDLTEKAGVCRASFYRNFFSMDEVVDEILNEFISWTCQSAVMNESNVAQVVCSNFSKILEEKDLVLLLMKAGFQNQLSEKFYEQTLRHIQDLDVFNNKYQPYFFSGASAAMIFAWADSGFSETPEEMTQIFMQSLHGYMKI